MASEPITVTDSDVQSLEKKLVEFAETLPHAEQLYLAGILATGIEDSAEVDGFVSRKAGAGQQEGLDLESVGMAPRPTLPPPRTPLESLQGWMSNLGVKV